MSHCDYKAVVLVLNRVINYSWGNRCSSNSPFLTQILLLSDVFTDRAQYEWVLMMMLDITRCHPMEDELLACYVVLATCKAAAVVGLVGLRFSFAYKNF